MSFLTYIDADNVAERRRCHELGIRDEGHVWRLVYRIDDDAIVILEVFEKDSGETPEHVKEVCRQRLKRYDEL